MRDEIGTAATNLIKETFPFNALAESLGSQFKLMLQQRTEYLLTCCVSSPCTGICQQKNWG